MAIFLRYEPGTDTLHITSQTESGAECESLSITEFTRRASESTIKIEMVDVATEQEADGIWCAVVDDGQGTFAYGTTEADALDAARELTRRQQTSKPRSNE